MNPEHPEHTDEAAPRRRADLVPSERDTRLSRQLLETLVQAWSRDAELLGLAEGGGTLLTEAAEAVEFGLGDAARGLRLHERGAGHVDADARSFAGVRRSARAEGSLDGLADLYEQELEAARTPVQAVLAAVGLAQARLYAGAPAAEIAASLRAEEPTVLQVPAEVAAAFRATLEDVLFAAGESTEALRTRVERWGDLRSIGDDVADACSDLGALAVAVASEVVGSSPAAVREWYEVAFETGRSAESLRPLLRACYDAGDFGGAEMLMAEATASLDDSNVRGRYQYELGIVRAMRLEDRPGGLSALNEAMKGGATSPVAAAAYLGTARSSHGTVVADDFVDALGASLDFAASGAERADLLTRMAQRFDSEMKMVDAAVDLARDALEEQPGYGAAVRLLGRIYGREGRWEDLVLLGERQLEAGVPEDERFRLHERMAEHYAHDLLDPTAAERHLRAALDLQPALSVIRSLSRLLSEQHRWEELYDHLRDGAARVALTRERAYLLEQAGEVAETRLRDGVLAIEVYRELLDVVPDHPSAITSLARLLSTHERWADLLELNEYELALTPDDRPSRVGILCRSAEIARRHMGDLTETENYYRRALEEDSTCAQALRGLGQILTAQERWDELVEMTESEMREARTDAHRGRCLRMLGQLHATCTLDLGRAVECFEALVELDVDATHEEALVWLDRLFETSGRSEERVSVLHRRFERAEDPASRARLAFRMGEVLEWHLARHAEAFEAYVESLADPLAAPLAMHAVDRLWAHTGIDDDLRRAALRCLETLGEGEHDELHRQALTLIGERGASLIDEDKQLEIWSQVAARWPAELRAAEFCAVTLLRRGQPMDAHAARALAPAGLTELALAHWADLDAGLDVDDLPPVPADVAPILAGFVSRERGDTAAPFEGAAERETYRQMHDGHVTLGELKRGGESEAARRLAILSARALNDVEPLREGWVDLARALDAQPIRATRAWLDLAGEDVFDVEERRGWLREAAGMGCYDPRLRGELYDAMSSAGDMAGLEEALDAHLREARPEAAEAARLSLRRGRCLEVQGRREDAIDALRFSAVHAPDDAAVALEKSRLETLADELDAARATLEDCLDAGVTGEERVDILGRLADLHQMPGGVRQRAIAALEDAWVLSESAKEWGIRLASAHAGFGRPERCVELLESCLEAPAVEDEIRHWQLLARVYATRLERPDEAEDILWGLFHAFPERRVTLQGLEEFYRRFQGAQEFAQRLGALLAEDRLEIADERAADLWKYVGELHFSVLRRFADAEDAFGRARGLAPGNADLVLREAKAIGLQGGRLKDAVAKLNDALSLGSADARLWEDAFVQLETFFEELGDPARIRVARQVRRALGANVEGGDERVKRDPTRELELALTWNRVGGGLFSEPDLEVLQAASPLAEKVFSRYAPSKKSVRGRKLKRDEFGAFDAYLTNAAEWLGITRPKISIGDAPGGAVAFDAGHFWVPEGRIQNDDPLRARFWAGWCAGLVFTDLVPLSWVDDAMVLELLHAVGRKELDLDVSGGGLLADEVGGLLLTPLRRSVAQAIEANEDTVRRAEPRWSQHAMQMADRAGLLLCGDVRTAVEEILQAEGWERRVEDPRTREVVVGNERLRGLLLYATSDDYFVARYESGLGERPYLFD